MSLVIHHARLASCNHRLVMGDSSMNDAIVASTPAVSGATDRPTGFPVFDVLFTCRRHATESAVSLKVGGFMTRKSLRLAFVILSLTLTAAIVVAQDFQKSYLLAEGNQVSIENVAGDILVKGYDGTEIIVTAFKEGRDRDLLSIEDFSTESNVDVRVKYPQNCNCDATIRFEVKVPQAINYNYDAFSTVSGNIIVDNARGVLHTDNVNGMILISNVSGEINASSFSGDVEIEGATEVPAWSKGHQQWDFRWFSPFEQAVGSVVAKTISGNVKVGLIQLDDSSMNRMEFSSLCGNVEVKVPDSLGAEVEMTTMIGKLETDFQLTVVKNAYIPGASARGRVGNGSHELKISSITGNVTLQKN
jgi:hypothetical protein